MSLTVADEHGEISLQILIDDAIQLAEVGHASSAHPDHKVLVLKVRNHAHTRCVRWRVLEARGQIRTPRDALLAQRHGGVVSVAAQDERVVELRPGNESARQVEVAHVRGAVHRGTGLAVSEGRDVLHRHAGQLIVVARARVSDEDMVINRCASLESGGRCYLR